MTPPAPPEVEQRPSQRLALARRVDSRIHQRRAEFYAGKLAPYIPRGSSLLDLGAGDGLLVNMLARSLDLKPRAFDVEARSLGGFPVEVYDGRRLPLPDGAVDVSICVAVLHHCEDAQAMLREIRRVTRKTFLLVEDRFDSAWDRLGVVGFHHYLRWIESMPFNRSGFASTSQWRDRLAAAGLAVTEATILGKPLACFPIVNTLFVAQTV